MLCPLCHSDEFVQYRRDFLQCLKCHLVVNPKLNDDGFESQIEEEFFGCSYDTETSFWDRTFENLNNSRTLNRIKKMGYHSGSLLEIGIGNGSLLAFMRGQGFLAEGCDTSAFLAKTVQENLGIQVYDKGLESIPKSKKYDVIVANHVLEHTSDPLKFLEQVKDHMHDSSILHLAVPNIDSWDSKLSGWVSYLPYHLVYFDQKTLSDALRISRFKPNQLMSHESFSGWSITISRTLYSLLKNRPNQKTQSAATKQNSAKRKSSAPRLVLQTILGVIGIISLPLRWVQSRLGKGDEIIVLAKLEN